MPEDLLLALLWENESMTMKTLLANGLVKRPAASRELRRLRQEYLKVYWQLANGAAP